MADQSGGEGNTDSKCEILPELLLEVLVRLPAKSLLRFKSVSKHWFSLITHPDFTEMHHTRSHLREGGAFLVLRPPKPVPRYITLTERRLHPYNWDRRFIMIDWRRKDPKDRASVHDPTSLPFTITAVTNIANGLVCFYHREDHKGCIYIYNLTTREKLALPLPDLATKTPIRRVCHMGFDPISKVYKILHIWSHNFGDKNSDKDWSLGDKQYCEALTLGSNENKWMPINILPGMTCTRSEPDCCNGGVLYWNKGYSHKQRVIVSFSLEHEKFDFINYPVEGKPRSLSTTFLALLGGQLSVVAIPNCTQSWYDDSPTCQDIVIHLWRLTNPKDNHSPVSTKQVTTCPFLNYGRASVSCSSFGLVSLVRPSKISGQVIIDCYMLATEKYIELKVNNAQGLLSPGDKFLPSKMAENILPLRNFTLMEAPDLLNI